MKKRRQWTCGTTMDYLIHAAQHTAARVMQYVADMHRLG